MNMFEYAVTGYLISADHIIEQYHHCDAGNINLVFFHLASDLCLFRLEYCYDVSTVESEGTHSKETD